MFVPAAKVKKRLKVVAYGEPGTGKTHFALSFPDPAVVDSEGGTDFFAGRVDFRVWKTKSFADLVAACEMVESGRVRCGTLVIDSITVFCDVLREAAFRVAEARARARGRDAADAALTVRDWGQVKMHIRSLLTRLYNLPCHTVITGWIKDEYEDRPDGRSIKVGQVLDGDRKILYQPDVVLRMEIRDGRYCAVVEKDRSGRHPRGAVLVNPSYADLAPAEDGEAAPAAPVPDESVAAEVDAALFRTGPEQLRAAAAAKGLTADELAALVRRKFGAPPEELTPEQIEEAAAGIAGADAAELKRAAARLLRGGAA